MKDETTRKLLEESLLHTSEDFTDQIMDKLEAETVRSPVPAYVPSLLAGSLLVILLVPLLLKGGLSVHLPFLQLNLSGLTVKILFAFFVFASIGRWLTFRKLGNVTYGKH
ncbi:MAG: hypothetical protein R2824_28350 [Saprospiraceae bacterium]|nr:hypothetical protein [Lewinella sp.]